MFAPSFVSASCCYLAAGAGDQQYNLVCELFSAIKNQLNLAAHRLANSSCLGLRRQRTGELGAGLSWMWLQKVEQRFSTVIFSTKALCWQWSSVRLGMAAWSSRRRQAWQAGSAQVWQEPGVSQITFPLQGRVCRKITFSAVAWPVPSKILILSTSIFYNRSSTNCKMNVEPQTKGTCLALCYFTL